MFLFLFATLLTSAVAAFAQPDSLWSRTFGGSGSDFCAAVIKSTNGGYALAGTTRSFTDEFDYWLIKTNENGDSTWSRIFSGGVNDRCNALIQTTDGGYVLAGYSGHSMEVNFFLLKTNANGDSLWSKTIGGESSDWCNDAIQTIDSGYALAGWTYSFGAQYNNFWLVKTDANGDSLWSRTYGTNIYDECYAVKQTTDGGFILAGRFFLGPSTQAWIVKTNEFGDSLWSQSLGFGQARDVQQTIDGGYVFAVISNEITSNNRFGVTKTDENGFVQWSHSYGYGEAYSIYQTLDGGFVVGGVTRISATGSNQFYILRLDSNGDSLWSRSFGGNGNDQCFDIQAAFNGGFVLAGQTSSFGAGIEDFWLVKTGPEPNAIRNHSPLPMEFSLDAYPNPFNSSVHLRFLLSKSSYVELNIYDLQGRHVTQLADQMFESGEHNLTFNASNLASGLYFARAYDTIGNRPVAFTKLLLLK